MFAKFRFGAFLNAGFQASGWDTLKQRPSFGIVCMDAGDWSRTACGPGSPVKQKGASRARVRPFHLAQGGPESGTRLLPLMSAPAGQQVLYTGMFCTPLLTTYLLCATLQLGGSTWERQRCSSTWWERAILKQSSRTTTTAVRAACAIEAPGSGLDRVLLSFCL